MWPGPTVRGRHGNFTMARRGGEEKEGKGAGGCHGPAG